MSNDSLQFERADFGDAAPARPACAMCNQEIVQSYYEFGGKTICSPCREKREQALDGWGLGRFLRALIAGAVAGAAGTVVWYLVRLWTEYEIGIISIAIGYAVGKAVHWGSSGKGGWLYQLLAVFLTYSAIAATYTPAVLKGAGEEASGSVLMIIVAFFVSYAVPFLLGFQNIIGLLIIAFGLWEAWKFNQRVDAAMTGPYTITPTATPAPSANV